LLREVGHADASVSTEDASGRRHLTYPAAVADLPHLRCRLTDESALLESEPFGPHIRRLETVLPNRDQEHRHAWKGRGHQDGQGR